MIVGYEFESKFALELDTNTYFLTLTLASSFNFKLDPDTPPVLQTTMSEYWVSHKKYFCKYCEIYIADDAPSKRQHENGLRHKGNRDRYVRGLYKEGERRKKDLDEEKREIERIEKASKHECNSRNHN